MANVTFANLPVASNLSGSEIIPMDQNGTTVRATASAIAALGTTSLTVGMAIAYGTSGTVLVDNGGNLGLTATTGSGNVVLATSPTLVTPNLGAATATSVTANGSVTASANTGAFNYGSLSYSDINNLSQLTSSANTYVQATVQNTNSGSSASSDVIVANNLSTATT